MNSLHHPGQNSDGGLLAVPTATETLGRIGLESNQKRTAETSGCHRNAPSFDSINVTPEKHRIALIASFEQVSCSYKSQPNHTALDLATRSQSQRPTRVNRKAEISKILRFAGPNVHGQAPCA
jgi:hypothetical protein